MEFTKTRAYLQSPFSNEVLNGFGKVLCMFHLGLCSSNYITNSSLG